MSAIPLGSLAPPAIFTNVPIRRSGPRPALGDDPIAATEPVSKPRHVEAAAELDVQELQPELEPELDVPVIDAVLDAQVIEPVLEAPVREAAWTVHAMAAKLRLETSRLRAAKPGMSPAELNARLGVFVRKLPANEQESLAHAMDAQRGPGRHDQFWVLMRDPDFARKYSEVNAAFLRSRSAQ
jgi:hypothetical protein